MIILVLLSNAVIIDHNIQLSSSTSNPVSWTFMIAISVISSRPLCVCMCV